MTSQLNVDTIVDKAGSGGSNVKMANTSTYVGEGGSGTQNTVQGLVKTWASLDFANTATDDSFNVSSITDVATGRQTVVHNNNMGSANYAGGGFSQAVLALYGEATDDPSFMTAAQCQLKNTSDTSSLVDHGKVTIGFFGDLA